jgi:hypothetical protein
MDFSIRVGRGHASSDRLHEIDVSRPADDVVADLVLIGSGS